MSESFGDRPGWPAVRDRLYWRTGVGGLVTGVVATLGIAFVTGDAAAAGGDVLGIGLLCVSLGLLGWGGTLVFTPRVRELQRYLGDEPAWDEAAPRRAMARVVTFGVGVLGGVLLTVLVF
ncbi:hypothetical protein VB773_06705 [Haloarculaceae archaeon H-GB2-1]|nr:hypothetical protein [Haloarculaceae archaeon H-GB1-1]MEA5385786.1 hypothetical protein [Haloarculaceae archaeon H-GB11]MEA5407288.1 hypothetical protein [Haloarculaceae archaeon H-GB2-1]